jgi:GxxExxY protein
LKSAGSNKTADSIEKEWGMLFEEYTYQLRQGFYAAHNEVGLGRQEEAYHRACRLWFAENEVPVASKPPHALLLDGEEACVLYPDFVGWDAVSVEIKALPRKLNMSEWVQIRDYMKCRGEALGLLVNFGLDRVYVERVTHTPRKTSLVENWEYWQDSISGEDRDVGIAVRDALRSVYGQHTTGYSDKVLSKLILFALTRGGLSVTVHPIAKAFYRDVQVDESPLECLVVEERLVLVYTALFDSNDFNTSRGLSYMKTLGLPWGVAANFGKERAEFRGLRIKK